ncbi:MAG TPA: carboxylating nicotinate-nucleotide diphosphorylase [bacterium]|nr:carboxylating nicotinate-nucleotide diphosphorylase [bacterium]HPQ19719.1 carboxylating nicotinate-nucleotide diphosphorylase [bacterium]
MNENYINNLLLQFLNEDILTGDITTDIIFEEEKKCEAIVYMKEEEGILCGVPFFKKIFLLLNNKTEFYEYYQEGEKIKKGEKVIAIYSGIKTILKGERTALNILQRLSGIATITRKYSELLKDTKIKILDTRKTLPGFRFFDKYAVRIGGGFNHRMGLYDAVLIKDNHIKGARNITEAIKKIKRKISPLYKIEVETKNISEVEEAINADVDIIMLDNMEVEEMKKAISIIKNKNSKILIEISGNITEEKIKQIKELDIDLISSGALTHSVKAIDYSLEII